MRWTAWSKPLSSTNTFYWAMEFHEFIPTHEERNKLFSGSGIQNGPIEFTFDKPVTNFTLWAYHIKMPGHAMTAYDANGVKIDSVDFAASSGTELNDVKVLTARGIRKVKLHTPLSAPYPNGDQDSIDWIRYRAGFEVDTLCPDTTDPILDNPDVRRALRDMLDSSRAWATPVSTRVERAGGIWRNDTTGELKVVPYTTTGSPCEILTITSDNNPGPGWTMIADVHTHPWRGATPTQASEVAPQNCNPKQRGRPFGSGEYTPSTGDWDGLRATGGLIHGYIVTPRYIVKYLGTHPAAANPANRPALTFHFVWSSPTCRLSGMRPPPVPPT